MPTVDELNIKIEAEAEKANSALDRLIGNFSSLSRSEERRVGKECH